MKNLFKKLVGITLVATMATALPVVAFAADADTSTTETEKEPTITTDAKESKVALKVGGAASTVTITAENGAEGDVIKVTSSDAKMAKVSYELKDNKLTLTAVASTGKTPVKLTLTYGKVKTTLEVSVEKADDIAESNYTADETLFHTDAELKTAIAADEVATPYVNGAKVTTKSENEKGEIVSNTVNYKTVTYYYEATEAVAKATEGAKFYTYVTTGTEAPTMDGTKVKETDYTKAAKDIATVKFAAATKTAPAKLEITAGKKAGDVDVYLFAVRDGSVVFATEIQATVKGADKSTFLFKDNEGVTGSGDEMKIDFSKAVTNGVVSVNATATFNVRGFLAADKKTNDFELAEDSTYIVSVDSKSKDFVELGTLSGKDWTKDDDNAVELKAGKAFTVMAKEFAYNPVMKKQSAKINILCVETNKKTSLTLSVVDGIVATNGVVFSGDYTIPNPAVAKQSVTIYAQDLFKADETTYAFAKDRLTYSIATTGDVEDIPTYSDKVAVYVTTKQGGVKAENGKVTIADKSKDITAKIDKNTSDITVTANKGVKAGTTAYLALVVTHEDKTVEIYEKAVTIAEKSPYLVLKKNVIKAPIFGAGSTEIEFGGADATEPKFKYSDEIAVKATYVPAVIDEETKKVKSKAKVEFTTTKPGNYVVFVEYEGLVEPVIVSGTAPKASTLSVKAPDKSVAVGGTMDLIVKAANGTVGNEKITVYTSDATKATVKYDDENGKVTVKGVAATTGKETVTIYVKYGHVIKNVKLTVTAASSAS